MWAEHTSWPSLDQAAEVASLDKVHDDAATKCTCGVKRLSRRAAQSSSDSAANAALAAVRAGEAWDLPCGRAPNAALRPMGADFACFTTR